MKTNLITKKKIRQVLCNPHHRLWKNSSSNCLTPTIPCSNIPYAQNSVASVQINAKRNLLDKWESKQKGKVEGEGEKPSWNCMFTETSGEHAIVWVSEAKSKPSHSTKPKGKTHLFRRQRSERSLQQNFEGRRVGEKEILGEEKIFSYKKTTTKEKQHNRLKMSWEKKRDLFFPTIKPKTRWLITIQEMMEWFRMEI